MRHLQRLITASMLAALALPVTAQDNAGGQQMMLRALDSNNDGTVSLEEFTASNAPMMSRIDANSDGLVSEEEFLTNFRNLGTMAGGMRQGGGGGNGGGRQLTDEQRARVAKRMEEQARGRFAAMDPDGDKQVTVAEYRHATFSNMDQNKDGLLSGDELSMQGRGAMAGGRRSQ